MVNHSRDSVNVDGTPGTRKEKCSMFENTVSLAPMVRAGSLPFRALCLKYGADLVWGEEIIDRRIIKCSRVVNDRLSTIDYNVIGERGKGNVDVLIFRTCSKLEAGKVVFQLGTNCPDRALIAARVVERDVAAIDINMGCPKKFSVQGGMGAALLADQDNACSIISNLSSNLSIPVSAKIRILDSLEATAAFMRRLEAAGASAITVHLRTKSNASNEPAQMSAMGTLASSVKIPVIANGDIYTTDDMLSVMQASPRGAAGVMLGRPVLLNPSVLLHLRPQNSQPSEGDGLAETVRNTGKEGSGDKESTKMGLNLDVSCLPIRTVIKDFLVECIRFEPPFQIIKYTIQEMNSQRRHRVEKLESLKNDGLFFGRVPEYAALSAAGSLSELCDIFGVEMPDNAVDIQSTSRTVKALGGKRSAGGAQRNDQLKKNKVVSPGGGPDAHGKIKQPCANEGSHCDKTIPLQLPVTDLRCDTEYFEGEEVTFLAK